MDPKENATPARQSEDIDRYPKFFRSPAEPRNTKDVLKSPQIKKNEMRPPIPAQTTTLSENEVPRRTVEIRMSPLNSANAKTPLKSKFSWLSASKAKMACQSPCKETGSTPRRKLDFNNLNKIKIETKEVPKVTMKMIFNSTSKENRLKPPMPPATIPNTKDFSLMESLSKNMHGVPRRTEEMLKSPLHCGMLNIRSASKIPSAAQIKTRLSPVPNAKRKFNFTKQALHNTENLQSACQPAYLRSSTEPCQLKESPQQMKISLSSNYKENQLKPPMPPPITSITKDFNLMESMSKNMHGEPRRTEEMLKSPLHCANANIRSVSSTSKITPTAASGCVPRRKLDFINKQAMRQMEERIASYLKQIPAFRVILNRGMHTMNVDDFVSITNHLLAFTGIRLKPLNKENYIKQTIVAAQLLKYPYKVNESCLRLPSLAFHSVMRIFDFLLDFAPMQDDCLPKDFNYYTDEYKIWCDNKIKLQDEHLSVLPKQEVDTDANEEHFRRLLQEEANLKQQLNECQEQLHAISLRSSVCDQKMGQQCIEIWRYNEQLKKFKKNA